MPLSDLPKIILVSDIAVAIGWSTRRTRRWLNALGALQKRGRKFVTTKSQLLLALPEAYAELEKSHEQLPEKK